MLAGFQPGARRRTVLLTVCVWAVLFGVAFTQWPLYSENQNTKFLHGLAVAGYGMLRGDWLANTVDPLPVFSALVAFTYRFLHPWLFYLYQAFLLGLYLFALLGIVDKVFGLHRSRAAQLLFLTVMIWLHSSLLPPFNWPVFNTSLGWLLQAGVANQYLFNPVFQPATFGVLLIVSVYLFLADHPYWAAASAAVAALFHSTYLPAAAMLTVAYMALSWWETRRLAPPIVIGGLAFLLVAPVLIYNGVMLKPTSPEAFAQAQSIIVNERIPQHSLLDVWVDNTVYVKVGLVALALFLVRRSRLFVIMLIPFAFAVAATLLQAVLASDAIAFLAPWRLSVFLVPLATGVILAWAINAVWTRWDDVLARHEPWIMAATGVLLAVVVLTGARAIRDSFAARRADPIQRVYAYVRANRQPDDVYLVPTGMADFRLATGVPVVVTWKSHPYKDVEMLEWKSRVDAVSAFYGEPHCIRIGELYHQYGATHVLFPGALPDPACPIIDVVYQDDAYTLARVK